MLSILILGNNSAVPTADRHPTAQVVTCSDRQFLVDCGEGTLIQMIRYHVHWGRIDYIFISHLHGDHYFGLIGLLTSLNLMGRDRPLYLYGPKELRTIIDLQLSLASTSLGYPLIFTPLGPPPYHNLVDEKNIQVTCFPTQHRIPCFGFLFREIFHKRKILAERAQAFHIPVTSYSALQEGLDYLGKDGKLIENSQVTADPSPAKSYAYCADTLYDEALIPYIQNCDLIYHETTYLQDQLERAVARFHSTTLQAATLAKKAGVKKLLIGHFSSKYTKIEDFEKECRSVFPATELGLEGKTFTVE